LADALLEAAGLAKAFGGVFAVRDVSLDLLPGEIHALIGPNGAGKSTVIGLLHGTIRADAGSVRFRGATLDGQGPAARARAGLARSYQRTAIFAGLTVAEHLGLAVRAAERRTFGFWRRAGVEALEVLQDFNFAAYCPYQTILNLQVYPFAVVMNKDVWESLPPDVQNVMDDLGPEQAEWTGEYMDGHVEEALEYAQDKYSTQVDRLSEEEMREMQATVSPIIDEWKKEAAEAGLPAEEIFRYMMALKEKYGQK